MAVKKVAKNIKFEEALAELEEQVRLLESGELSLEQGQRWRAGYSVQRLPGICRLFTGTVR